MNGGAALLGELVERAPAGRVTRNLGVLEPGTVYETEEVVLRTDGTVEVGSVDAERANRRGLLLLGRSGRGQQCGRDRGERNAEMRMHETARGLGRGLV